MITIKLNDKQHQVAEGTTLNALMEKLGIQLQGIAIAINYEVIPKNKWNETILTDGMTLMMVQAVSGG
jgi:sulfur carrier protein